MLGSGGVLGIGLGIVRMFGGIGYSRTFFETLQSVWLCCSMHA